MGVIGHWRRSVLGAGGVALLLPIGLALGIALTTAFGGAATLRALGQVFAGPSAPNARGGSSEPGLESFREVPSVPVRIRPAPHSAPTPSSSADRPGPARSPASGDTSPTRPSGPEPSPAPGPTPAAPTQPADGPAASPAPEAQPQDPGGSALNETGQGAADAVQSLPAPVGTVGGDAVQTVVDLIP